METYPLRFVIFINAKHFSKERGFKIIMKSYNGYSIEYDNNNLYMLSIHNYNSLIFIHLK